ncbi:MAG: peptidylprolyl isomerase, partial [Alphaproteobacteria bacterium]
GVGEFSEAPVQTQFGWHVIKVEDKRAIEPPTFEQSRARIQGEMARDAITAHIAQLRSSANIQRFGLDGELIEEEQEPTEAN